MARLSKEERAELEQQKADAERRMKEDDETASYDPDVEVGGGDGTWTRLPYSLARHHYPDRFKDPEPPKAPDEAPKDKAKKDEGGEVKRFQSGRRVS